MAGESLGQALDRAFAERIKLPEGDTAHAGAPIQDTRAAPIPGPPSPPTDKDKGQDKTQEKTEANGDVDQPTETTAAGIAQAGHEQTDAVDPSMSSSAPHPGGPTGGSSDTHAHTLTHARTQACRQHKYEQVLCCTVCRACLRMVCSLRAATYLLSLHICPGKGRNVTHHVMFVCHAKLQLGQRLWVVWWI